MAAVSTNLNVVGLMARLVPNQSQTRQDLLPVLSQDGNVVAFDRTATLNGLENQKRSKPSAR
jgi:hypothetical protein